VTDGWAPDDRTTDEGVDDADDVGDVADLDAADLDDLDADDLDDLDGSGDGEAIDAQEYQRMREALADAQRRLADTPVEDIVANHVRGLFELATIHLFSAPANLHGAALAIDAMGCVVEGLGDRLEPHAAVLREALHNSRLAFVQVKGSMADAGAGPAGDTPGGSASAGSGEAPEG
jgi:hypothetical protein